MRLFAPRAFLPDGWASGVLIEIAADGTFGEVRAGSEPVDAETLDGAVVPGMPNVHSHTFQRAMAGTAERRAHKHDDFWSWRESMYELAATLDPDSLYAMAIDVYRRMLEAGYTSVAEFHYLHRDPDGRWYDDRAVMARALVAAAKVAGIAICLLPALYAHGGIDGTPLSDRQRRFATSVDDVLAIATAIRREYAGDPDVVVGVCAHSLRAVTPGELRGLIAGSPGDVPIHLHIAEQSAEVEAVRRALGARPVEWLLANHDVDGRWCLVHATHITGGECRSLARSGAIVGLCPTTEANLGDGLFPLEPYLHAGGRFGIGSDSNVSISVTEELRWLEYGQRLATRKRLVMASNVGESCGERSYRLSALHGAAAIGRRAGSIVQGARADFAVIPNTTAEQWIMDRWIFANEMRPSAVYVSGARRA